MADVRDMYMAHTMMRREFRLLPQLVRDVPEGSVQRAELVGSHAELLCQILHLHHEGEDLVLWPLLAERGGEEAAVIVPTMEEQHHAIEQAHAAAMALLPGWRAEATGGEELAEALDQLLAVLLEHMATEEKEILPLAAKYVTAAEWDRMGQHGLANSPKRTLPLTFGMVMYEGDPEVVKAVLVHAPLPARLLMPRLAPRLYASHAKRVHGTPTPPRVGC
ncbi:hemerythrin domain-containing protein [Streptomyces sp. S.PB5]|uniref:hemerythrin domain-containing protein n=1 Tax=Streptomyces sp. S.PB5 TaxID=3020844 RepID=UPI0025B10640|nr:hemerythrin domain-containing protein [Streptomyces sp. S.PB5]MDN3029677.1 hemerythrin domain-containing protein [Streptomyces sp. S.PB5]